MKRLAIVGAATLGQQLRHWTSRENDWTFVGFYDDFAQNTLGRTSSIVADFKAGRFDELLIGVGYKAMNFRYTIADIAMSSGIPLSTYIHPLAYVDSTAKIGQGCVILPGVTIDQYVKLDANIFVSIGSSISHDTSIGASCYISPHTVVCGKCVIGQRCFLGAGSVVRDHIHIDSDLSIGCGAVVVNDLYRANGRVYIGIPAHPLEKT